MPTLIPAMVWDHRCKCEEQKLISSCW